MNKSLMWIMPVIILCVGVFIGYYAEKVKMTNQLAVTQTVMQKKLDDQATQFSSEKSAMMPTSAMARPTATPASKAMMKY